MKKSRGAQIFTATMDGVGYCTLATPTKAPIILPVIAEMLNARYGSSLSDQDVLNIGVQTIKEELSFNRRAGIDPKYDLMPEFLKEEPLPHQNSVFDIPRIEIESIWEDL